MTRHPSPLRQLALTVVLASATVLTALGAELRMTGSVSWRIQSGECTLNVTRLENNSAPGSRSGSLRVCLWVTPSNFPQSGYRVATANLDSLRGGYYYSGLSLKTKASLPKVTGDYLFTVAVEEYTSNGWRTRDFRKIGFQYLKSGKFASRPAWKAPSDKVIKAPAKLKVGTRLVITLQGSQLQSGAGVTYVPKGSQLQLKVRLRANGRTTVFGGSRPDGAPAIYRYSRTKDQYNGKTHQVGRLFLDYGAASDQYVGEAYSDHRLFFQKPKRGFYKAIDVQQSANFRGTSWGVFRIR